MKNLLIILIAALIVGCSSRSGTLKQFPKWLQGNWHAVVLRKEPGPPYMIFSESGFYLGEKKPSYPLPNVQTIVQTESGDIIATPTGTSWQYKFKRDKSFVSVYSIRPADNQEFSVGLYQRK